MSISKLAIPRLTRAERNRLLAGDYDPLHRDEEPGWSEGAAYVLSWSRELRSTDQGGNVAIAPPFPLRWIVFATPIRKAKGGWSCRFSVVDRRQRPRFMRAKPPERALERGEADTPPSAEEIEAAHDGGAYTSDARLALDHLEVIDGESLERYAREARDSDFKREAEERAVEERRSLVERLHALERENENVDLGRQMARVRQAIEAAEAKVRRLAA